MQRGLHDNGDFFEDWMHELLWPSSSSGQNPREHHQEEESAHHTELLASASPNSCASCDSEPEMRPSEPGDRRPAPHELLKSAPIIYSQQIGNTTKDVNSKMRHAKVALETKSDNDILDDGYKWRKYGQKFVKNSKHPRSYYRCSLVGCPVKKRVERSTLDPTLVLTTYHNMHNHHTPTTHHMDTFGLPLLEHN